MKTELILYEQPTLNLPIANNSNGVTAVEKPYRSKAVGGRKFTDDDMGLLNDLYSAHEGSGYLWSVKGVLEEFGKRTGKSISRSTLYRHVDQTREGRATVLVLATPTTSAIEVYSPTTALMPIPEQSSPRKISPSQLLEDLQNIKTADGIGNLYKGLAGSENFESSLVQLSNMQIKLRRGRRQFYENKRNWQGVIDTDDLAMLWFNPYLWRHLFPNEEDWNTYLKIYLPFLAIITSNEFINKYNFAKKKLDEKPILQRALGILSRR